jgi:hypothetical protein
MSRDSEILKAQAKGQRVLIGIAAFAAGAMALFQSINRLMGNPVGAWQHSLTPTGRGIFVISFLVLVGAVMIVMAWRLSRKPDA